MAKENYNPNPESQSDIRQLDWMDLPDLPDGVFKSSGELELWIAKLINKEMAFREEIRNPDGSLKEVRIRAAHDLLGPDQRVLYKKNEVVDFQSAEDIKYDDNERLNNINKKFGSTSEGAPVHSVPVEMARPESLKPGKKMEKDYFPGDPINYKTRNERFGRKGN